MERHTRQRQAVLDALAGSGRTLSPPDILTLAQRQAPRLNLSTVYRQIKVLEEEGVVLRVQLPGLPARFEARCTATQHGAGTQGAHHHHHHFHCLACGHVMPIHGCLGPMHELAPAGCEVERHDLVLHGRCAACAEGARA